MTTTMTRTELKRMPGSNRWIGECRDCEIKTRNYADVACAEDALTRHIDDRHGGNAEIIYYPMRHDRPLGPYWYFPPVDEGKPDAKHPDLDAALAGIRDLDGRIASLTEGLYQARRATNEAKRDAALAWVKCTEAESERERVRDAVARLEADLAQRPAAPSGPITEEPQGLGHVIVAESRSGALLYVRGADERQPWFSETGKVAWGGLHNPRWATAEEIRTGTVHDEQPTAGQPTPAPDHPEHLEGAEAYDAAPLGTIADSDWGSPLSRVTRLAGGWRYSDGTGIARPLDRRRVVRWGFGPGWEPGTDVTDRITDAPEGVILVDCDGDLSRSEGEGRFTLRSRSRVTWGDKADFPLEEIRDYSPIRVATPEQLAAAGILGDR